MQQVANLTEAEALLQLSNCQESDEGIVSDQSSVTDPEDPTAKRFKVSKKRGFFFLHDLVMVSLSSLNMEMDCFLLRCPKKTQYICCIALVDVKLSSLIFVQIQGHRKKSILS